MFPHHVVQGRRPFLQSVRSRQDKLVWAYGPSSGELTHAPAQGPIPCAPLHQSRYRFTERDNRGCVGLVTRNMLRIKTQWTRFWCNRLEKYAIDSDGYLLDPESEWARYLPTNVKVFSDLLDSPCLVLLGEPGMGKTTCLDAEITALANMAGPGTQIVRIDLGEYGNESRLVQDVFCSSAFLDCVSQGCCLELILDSFDECHAHIPTLPRIFEGCLGKHPRDALARFLRLRIACRTANWPASLERVFQRIWGDAGVGVFELTPLRRRDVVSAAANAGLVADEFIQAVADKAVHALAARPITLQFLLSAYASTGQLPPDRCQLYEEGCRHLAEEANRQRRDSGLIGKLTPDDRLAIASEIAALMTFCNKTAILLGLQGDSRTDDLLVSQLSAEQGHVREALSTGLFTGCGAERVGFAHQTYAEFLAARHVHTRRVSPKQLLQLLRSPSNNQERIVPQLAEVASWLTSMVPALRPDVIRTDPIVALYADVALWTDEQKSSLTLRLLRGFDGWEFIDADWALKRQYRKLAFPGMSAILEPYIRSKVRNSLVRRNAIDMARECDVRGNVDSLLWVCLDETDEYYIRCLAAAAVVQLGNQQQRLCLKQFLPLSIKTDQDDELRAHALTALWPDHLSAEEVFGALHEGRQWHLGAMWRFLTEFAETLRPEDLPAALTWAATQQFAHDDFSSLRNLVTEIIRLAWNHVEHPGVADALARLILLRLSRHDDIWGNKDRNAPHTSQPPYDSAKREVLLCAIVDHLAEEQDILDSVSGLVFAQPPIITHEDVPWLLDRIRRARSNRKAECWIALLKQMIQWTGALHHIWAIYSTAPRIPLLKEAFRSWWEAVDLASDLARQERQTYAEHRNRVEEHERSTQAALQPIRDWPPAARIEHYLCACEHGNLLDWIELCRALALTENSTSHQIQVTLNLTTLPGWASTDTAVHSRMLRVAQRVVQEIDPKVKAWLGKNQWYYPATSGCKALALLALEASDLLASLPEQVWRTWGPALVGYPFVADKDSALVEQLVSRSFRSAEELIIRSVLKVIDLEKGRGCLHVLSRLEGCHSESLTRALFRKAQEPSLNPRVFGQLLRHAVHRQHGPATRFAERLLQLPLSRSRAGQERTYEAAIALLLCAPNAGWTIVWPVLQKCKALSRRVMASVAGMGAFIDAPPLPARLTESQVADFYLLLSRGFGSGTGNSAKKKGSPRADDRVLRLRDGLLSELQARGTPEACAAIERISRRLGSTDSLRIARIIACDALLARSWIPVEPAELLEICQSSSTRLVRSGNELQQLVVDELRALESELRESPPGPEVLWNENGPKNEAFFSDYVALCLNRALSTRGAVGLREVQVRRGGRPDGRDGHRAGERTDIYVTGTVERADGYTNVTTIIEIKGSWNRDLMHAMKTQLAGRYLRDHGFSNGIYLVGWFGPLSQRASKARPGSCQELQSELDSQAVSLSGNQISVKAVVIDVTRR